MNLAELNNLLNSELTSKIKESKEENGELLINVELANIYSTLLFLKTDSKCKFRQLIDILAVDFPGEEDRFKIYYLLLSHENNLRIKIVSHIQIDSKVPSITKIYPSANWMEREVFDMYGVKFKNHPDLRRILTDYNFKGFPLRKDFPLTGFNEVRYSEKDKKVIYEPVKLEQNYRNFDFSSPWEGTKYIKDAKEKVKND
tara:strand:+ start:216 stop:815 length:600 start_codon:yes stop_codon:yes gene_type:complete